MVGQAIDLVFEEMVMKFVDLHFQVEFVDEVEDNIMEEK